MENKPERGTRRRTFPFLFRKVYLLPVVFLISGLALPFESSGQKLTNYYAASLLESGTLYFIFPIDDFQQIRSKSRLIFDISYLSSRDSATLNFSYFHSSAVPAFSITLKSGENVTVCTARKLFMDLENHQKWHHRYTSTVHLNDLESFFQSALPPEILITTEEDRLIYQVGRARWKKHGSILSSIIQMIRANS